MTEPEELFKPDEGRRREAEKTHLAPGPGDAAAESVVRFVEKPTERPTIRIVAGELPKTATAAERALIESGLPIYQARTMAGAIPTSTRSRSTRSKTGKRQTGKAVSSSPRSGSSSI